MDIQTPSSVASTTSRFSTQSKRQAAQSTVAQLLDDKDAMNAWTNNIEKIRQKESAGVTKPTT